jgi:hypothetical protein
VIKLDSILAAEQKGYNCLDGIETFGSTHRVKTTFLDKYNICSYFPGYLRNKKIWENLKGSALNRFEFNQLFGNRG